MDHVEEELQRAFLPPQPAVRQLGVLVGDQTGPLQRLGAEGLRQGMLDGGLGDGEFGHLGRVLRHGLVVESEQPSRGLAVGPELAGVGWLLLGDVQARVDGGDTVVVGDLLVDAHCGRGAPGGVLLAPLGAGTKEEQNVRRGLAPANLAHDALDRSQNTLRRLVRIVGRKLHDDQAKRHVVPDRVSVGAERPQPRAGLRQALFHDPEAPLGKSLAEGAGEAVGQVLALRHSLRRAGRAAEHD
jgi:hypothetical protein